MVVEDETAASGTPEVINTEEPATGMEETLEPAIEEQMTSEPEAPSTETQTEEPAVTEEVVLSEPAPETQPTTEGI